MQSSMLLRSPPSTCSSGWLAKLHEEAVPRNRLNNCKAPRIFQIACVHTTTLTQSVTCVLNAVFNMAGDMDEMQRGLESKRSHVSSTSSAILNTAFSTQVTDFANIEAVAKMTYLIAHAQRCASTPNHHATSIYSRRFLYPAFKLRTRCQLLEPD
jgi:hypothetical protein